MREGKGTWRVEVREEFAISALALQMLLPSCPSLVTALKLRLTWFLLKSYLSLHNGNTHKRMVDRRE